MTLNAFAVNRSGRTGKPCTGVPHVLITAVIGLCFVAADFYFQVSEGIDFADENARVVVSFVFSLLLYVIRP